MSVLEGKVMVSGYRDFHLEPYRPQSWVGGGMALLNLSYGELALFFDSSNTTTVSWWASAYPWAFDGIMTGKNTILCMLRICVSVSTFVERSV